MGRELKSVWSYMSRSASRSSLWSMSRCKSCRICWKDCPSFQLSSTFFTVQRELVLSVFFQRYTDCRTWVCSSSSTPPELRSRRGCSHVGILSRYIRGRSSWFLCRDVPRSLSCTSPTATPNPAAVFGDAAMRLPQSWNICIRPFADAIDGLFGVNG